MRPCHPRPTSAFGRVSTASLTCALLLSQLWGLVRRGSDKAEQNLKVLVLVAKTFTAHLVAQDLFAVLRALWRCVAGRLPAICSPTMMLAIANTALLPLLNDNFHHDVCVLFAVYMLSAPL